MRRFFLLAIIVWQSFFLAANADAAERIALVFGNGDYLNAPRLPNPVNDATDVAAAFVRLGFSVQLIKNGNFEIMRRALLIFAQQAPSAVAPVSGVLAATALLVGSVAQAGAQLGARGSLRTAAHLAPRHFWD